MNPFEENELRSLFLSYEVKEPSQKLVTSTKRYMFEELGQLSAEPLKTEKWVFLLVVMAIVMSLCLFYMLTIGTILWFVIPSNLVEILRHTQFAFVAVCCSVLACTLMVFCFKEYGARLTESIV